MCNFTTTFLIRTLWITIKDMCSATIALIKLDCQRVSKFTSSVGQNHLEEARACLKNHFRNLQAPICGRFYPHSDKISHKLGLTAQEKPFSDTFRSSRFRIRRSTEESAESGSSCCHCFRSHSHHYFRSKPEGSRSRECSYSFRFRPRN